MSKTELTFGRTHIFSRPCCLSLGRPVARARMPFPSCQPNSLPVLLVSGYFPEKPLSKPLWEWKVSHPSSPLGDAEASAVRTEPVRMPHDPSQQGLFLEKYPNRELVQSRWSDDWSEI
ncbi:unnamed protein product [Pipistrellus nathusii]|uniref:Uncharacterized protein n=1 Tax=Pipistrellus nathusii TaxID=59473 RepID=A0ABN9ZY91_PIPNA